MSGYSPPFVASSTNSVVSSFPERAPSQAGANRLVYLIDASDCLLTLQEPLVKPPNFEPSHTFDLAAHVGRSIFDFMADCRLRLLYRMIYRGLRTHRRLVVLPFRADSPTLACHMELSLTVLANNAILHESRLIHSEPHCTLQPWATNAPSADEFMTICGWCQRLQQNDQWQDVETVICNQRLFERAVLPQLTHGICPTCCDKVVTELHH